MTSADTKSASGTKSSTGSSASQPPKQDFFVSHYNGDEDFKVGGLRKYIRYRNLGIEKATHGIARAEVARMVGPCTDEMRKKHYHQLQFQMNYVLKGWIIMRYEGIGDITMREGSAWVQPPGSVHSLVDFSDDFETIEINLPAQFETVDV
jgi:hypothetical protein